MINILDKILIDDKPIRFRELSTVLEDLNSQKLNYKTYINDKYNEIILSNFNKIDSAVTSIIEVSNIILCYSNLQLFDYEDKKWDLIYYIFVIQDNNCEYPVEFVDKAGVKMASSHLINLLYESIKFRDLELSRLSNCGSTNEVRQDIHYKYRDFYSEAYKTKNNECFMRMLHNITVFKSSLYDRKLNKITIRTKRKEVELHFNNLEQMLKDIEVLGYKEVERLASFYEMKVIISIANFKFIYLDNELSEICINIKEKQPYKLYFEDSLGVEEEINAKANLIHMIYSNYKKENSLFNQFVELSESYYGFITSYRNNKKRGMRLMYVRYM